MCCHVCSYLCMPCHSIWYFFSKHLDFRGAKITVVFFVVIFTDWKKKKDVASNIGTGVLHIPNFLQPVTFMTDISLRWKSILWALCHAWLREECVIMLGGRELCYFKLHIYFEFSSGPAKVLFCVMFSWRFCVWTLYIIAFLEGIVFFLKVSYCTVLYTNMCFIP